MIRLLLCSLASLLLALPAHADEVRLKNGDRITGVATSLSGGTLTFKAPGGDLTIAGPSDRTFSLTLGYRF